MSKNKVVSTINTLHIRIAGHRKSLRFITSGTEVEMDVENFLRLRTDLNRIEIINGELTLPEIVPVEKANV